MKHAFYLASAVGLALLSCRTESAHQQGIPKQPTTAVNSVAHPETGIALPSNYRQTFTNYLSLDRVQNHDQIIRLFANDIAMRGPNENNELPFGSVIVAEIYKAKLDGHGKARFSSLGRRMRDKMALIAVMQREEHLGRGYAEDLQNGHWDFAAFTPEGKFSSKDLDSCRACHAPLKDRNHVFSLDHLRK